MGRTSRPRGNHAIHGQRRGFVSQKVQYEAPGDGIDPYMAADLALTKRIAETLERHYPAHPWMVAVTHAQGIAKIKLPVVMSSTEAYVIHLTTIAVDPGLRCVVRAGGELLERYRMPRQQFRLDPFLDARAQGPYGRPRPRLILPA